MAWAPFVGDGSDPVPVDDLGGSPSAAAGEAAISGRPLSDMGLTKVCRSSRGD
jgi:hypothetical protein